MKNVAFAPTLSSTSKIAGVELANGESSKFRTKEKSGEAEHSDNGCDAEGLTQPTVLPNGKRIPGLKLDHPRQLAVMHALVRFSSLAAGTTFTTTELHPHVLRALGLSAADYKLGSLRYDLWKLRAKGLIEKIPSFPPLSAAAQRLSDLRALPNASG